jgi:hypothetical protein
MPEYSCWRVQELLVKHTDHPPQQPRPFGLNLKGVMLRSVWCDFHRVVVRCYEFFMIFPLHAPVRFLAIAKRPTPPRLCESLCSMALKTSRGLQPTGGKRIKLSNNSWTYLAAMNASDVSANGIILKSDKKKFHGRLQA